nr:putative ribonuclease H-like domain-containing protein [Tanacetum cinerariifolium]
RRTNHKDYQNCLLACFLSQIEPKKVNQALTDPRWIEAIKEELLQFRLQKVWRLVDLPKSKHAIGKNRIEAIRRMNQDLVKKGDKNNQEKDLRDQEAAPRKQFEQESERLFGQGEAVNTNSTNRLNTVSSPVNAVSSSFTTIDTGRERAQRNKLESMFRQDKDANGNMMFTLVSAAGFTYVNLGGSIPINATTLPNADFPTDPLMPDLEDTADLQDT